MNKRILMTLPKSDDATEYLATFSKPIIDFCFDGSINITLLEKEKSTKVNFEKLLKKLDFNMIIFNGHGSPECITGHQEKKIIQLGENEELLLGKITYARSCWFARGLIKNKKHVNDEIGCFIGYNLPFKFLINPTWATNPCKDNTARIFFDTSNLIPLGLMKGNSAQEVHDNSRKSMLKAISKALNKIDADSLAIAECLWNNYSCQEIIGNSNSRFI